MKKEESLDERTGALLNNYVPTSKSGVYTTFPHDHPTIATHICIVHTSGEKRVGTYRKNFGRKCSSTDI